MKKLTEWLSSRVRATDPLPPINLQNAIGVILVRMARSDLDYQRVEIEQIDRILASAYHLEASESAQLRTECEQLEAYVDDIDQFTAIVRDWLTYSERLTICDATWAVLLADSVVRLSEKQMMEETEKALGIAHSDSYVIRHKDTSE
jgi:uncharacterized tellurite resistance protein B-like protein